MKQRKEMIMRWKSFLLVMMISTAGAYASSPKSFNDTIVSDKDSVSMIQSMLENKSFVFKAQYAKASGSDVQNLYNYYDLSVNGNEAAADLPYSGKAYTSTPLLDESGIMFTSNDFNYTVNKADQGWEIEIDPNDTRTSVKLNLHVNETGDATLLVRDHRRPQISFNGYIEGHESESMMPEMESEDKVWSENEDSFFFEPGVNTEIDI